MGHGRPTAGLGFVSKALAPGALALFLALGTGGIAAAKDCGDEVPGLGGVPCACGDTVVSSVKLRNSDPVVNGAPCPKNGLVVKIQKDREGTTVIDLNGKQIRGSCKYSSPSHKKAKCRGIGLQVKEGGVDGIIITSTHRDKGKIKGFKTGVRVSAKANLKAIYRIRVNGDPGDHTQPNRNAKRGFDIKGNLPFLLSRTHVEKVGQDAYHVKGTGYALLGNEAINNGGKGFVLRGRDAVIGDPDDPGERNRANNNDGSGFDIKGKNFAVIDAVANGNDSGADGFRFGGRSLCFDRCSADDNEGSGLYGTGRGDTLCGNETDGNLAMGILVKGKKHTDLGGNMSLSGNVCEIGGAACLPGECLDEDPCDAADIPICGNGEIETGEECDDGVNGNSDVKPNACRADCTNPTCGDGVTDDKSGEECDDGNTMPGDGCDGSCKLEAGSPGGAFLSWAAIPS